MIKTKKYCYYLAKLYCKSRIAKGGVIPFLKFYEKPSTFEIAVNLEAKLILN